MRALLVALAVPDPASLRAALAAALGTTSVDLCQATEAAATWLENRPCDMVAVAGQGRAVVEAVARLRRVSRTIPILAVVPDPSDREAGAAWLSGADDVVTAAALAAGVLPEGLDEIRHQERDVLRRTQRVWYAGPADALRQHLGTRLGARVRDVGLSGEGLVGLTTQDLETPHSSALIVNAASEPDALVLGVRRVKRTYPGLAITVVAEGGHHDAFRRAGADECLGVPADVDPVLHAVGRAQAACRSALDLDVVRARESRLRALLEHLPEAVMLVSPEHAVLAVNLAALRLIGAQDARQVLGSPLAPWFDADDDHADSAIALVDAVTGGASRELFTRTRHLADPRRLLLRAVPFQRETGGSPAALIVLREVLDAPVVDAAPASIAIDTAELDEARLAWSEERASFQRRGAELEAELNGAREALATAETIASALGGERDELAASHAMAVAATQAIAAELEDVREQLAASATRASSIDAAEATDTTAHADADALASIRVRLERFDALGIDVDDIPGLVDAARRLTILEQDELPALLSRAEAQRQEQEAALRDQLSVAASERDRATAALEDATRRVTELDSSLARAMAQNVALEAAVRTASPAVVVDAATPSHVDVSDEHSWILQEIAHIGVIKTARDGRILEANVHAARLCGYASPQALLDGQSMPEPLTLLADGDPSAPARFEVCLQLADDRPRWVAGARLPAHDDGDVTWLLADASGSRTHVDAGDDRPELITEVLDAVATECTAIVNEAPVTVRGPRSLDAPTMSPAAAQALGRARVLLAQVSAFRKRRDGQLALDELRTHLEALDPVLRRLATDDVEWEVSLPAEPVLVGVSAADLERCLMALVAGARDALPLGGRLVLSVHTPGARQGSDLADVRRLDAHLVLEAQGYGLAAFALPATLRDLAAGFGGVLDVEQVDGLTGRVTLHVPRAFVVSHAA